MDVPLGCGFAQRYRRTAHTIVLLRLCISRLDRWSQVSEVPVKYSPRLVQGYAGAPAIAASQEWDLAERPCRPWPLAHLVRLALNSGTVWIGGAAACRLQSAQSGVWRTEQDRVPRPSLRGMQLCASLLLVQLPASSRSTQPFQHALLLFIQTVSVSSEGRTIA